MRYLILLLMIVSAGCASVQLPEYIGRVDHPYDRTIYANFDKVTAAMIFVLKQKGWTITTEAVPSIYERDERYDNNGYQNLILITDFRKSNLTSTHLNILIHSIGNTCDVEVRYEARTSLVKQFISVRNDRMAEDILDAVEREIK